MAIFNSFLSKTKKINYTSQKVSHLTKLFFDENFKGGRPINGF